MAPETVGARLEEGQEVPAGLTEVRLPNGIYQWLNSEQLARRQERRDASLRHARRRPWREVATTLGALLLVFLIAGLFVHCRVREASTLVTPERPAAVSEQGSPPLSRE